MSAEPEFHPVYTALIRRPEMLGVDQRFVVIGPAALVGIFLAGRFTLAAFGLGLLVMVACHLLLRWMYAHEPQLLPMLWKVWGQKGRYDPLKHAPVYIEVKKQW